MEKQKNSPALRFAEFTEGWVMKKLGELTDLITKGTTPTNFVNEGIKFIKIECFDGDKINPKKCLFIDDETHNKELKRSILQEGDILFAIAGATIGKVNIVTNEILPANTNQALCIVRLRKNENLNFIFQVLKSVKMQKYIVDSISVGAQPNLNLEQMNNFSFFYPSKAEQQKIATFFTAIDKKLSGLKEKKNLLEQYKKGAMQQLFAIAETDGRPSVRFKNTEGGDFEDWEKKKLGDIGTFFSGGTPLTSKRQYFNGNIPFIRSGEIHSDKTEQFISEEGLKNSSAKIVEVGDLLYALYGATSGEVGISKIKGAINQALLCIRTKMDNRFLNNFLFLNKENIIKTYLQGGQGNLSADIIKSLVIPIPCLAEQTQIANYLSALDEKIQGVSTQLEKMERWKKGLLQQMFV